MLLAKFVKYDSNKICKSEMGFSVHGYSFDNHDDGTASVSVYIESDPEKKICFQVDDSLWDACYIENSNGDTLRVIRSSK